METLDTSILKIIHYKSIKDSIPGYWRVIKD